MNRRSFFAVVAALCLPAAVKPKTLRPGWIKGIEVSYSRVNIKTGIIPVNNLSREQFSQANWKALIAAAKQTGNGVG